MFIFPVVFDWRLFGFTNRSRVDMGKGIGVVCMGVYIGIVGGGNALIGLWRDVRDGRPDSGVS